MKMLSLSIAVIFKPVETFKMVKAFREGRILSSAFTLLIAFIAVRIASIYITHYPMASLLPNEANFLIEILKYYVPTFTWVIASFAVTSILGGESQINEIFLATSYSMMPFIMFTLPLSLLSRILSQTEAGIYDFLNSAIWMWILILFFVSVKTLNEFSLKKTFFICFLTIIVMLLIWAAFILIFALSAQIVSFVREVILEMRMQYLE